jgi:protein-S-isoprenylcysteine O-methyltransferase Ste14
MTMAKNLQGKLPILLSVGFVTLIVALGAEKLASWGGAARVAGAAIVVLYLAWLALEARVATSEIGKERTSLDRGTLEAYALARALTVTLALGLGGPPATPLRLAAGAALFASGVAFRLHAIRVLGRFYSHRVRVAGDHEVVDHGPYRFIRHPAYTGMLVAHAGFVTAFFHPVAAAALVLLFVPAVIARIRVEETALASLAGYAEYSRSRARLVPGVW